jgi:hypothetical protein
MSEKQNCAHGLNPEMCIKCEIKLLRAELAAERTRRKQAERDRDSQKTLNEIHHLCILNHFKSQIEVQLALLG